MVTETVIETPTETQVDQSQTEIQTETPETPVVEERAAETPSEDAAPVPQVEVTEQKPDYMTRADWEREKADVAVRAGQEALELDRRRRQTENARKAKQEVTDREEQQEATDVIRAALVAQGYDPSVASDEAVTRTVDRLARKKAERFTSASLDTVDQAWDYLVAPAYGRNVELDDTFADAAQRLGPRVQHLVNTIRPAIEAEARKGYIPESELPKRYEQMDAARNAKAREGQEEIRHVGGAPSTDNSTIADRLDRIGTPRETAADRQWWNAREKARGR